MKTLPLSILCIVLFSFTIQSQTINDIIEQVNLDSLMLTVNELSGELPTEVYGNTVTIINRQQFNNDLAADYIKRRFEGMDNLIVVDQPFNSNGRNIIATQIGKTNPDDIYMICAHYDAVADYCADDNATGVAAVLEIARILSKQCLNNTIVYALWDEEEIGLLGSEHYASEAAVNGDNILGVLNIDMMGYDGNDDGNFDIDVRNIAGSLDMKDDIIEVLNNPEYDFTLSVNVVNPGTTASDHSRFWDEGFSAVLIGESWETNDQTPFYHSSEDKASTINQPYFHQLTQLIMGYMVTKGHLVEIDNTLTQTSINLTSNQNFASYQWYDCNANMPISGATSQTFTPVSNGIYAVEVISGDCVEFSDCVVFDTLAVEELEDGKITISPNPVSSILTVKTKNEEIKKYEFMTLSGKQIYNKVSNSKTQTFNLQDFSEGIYFLKVSSNGRSKTFKIVKK